jgi:hypothetical protein
MTLYRDMLHRLCIGAVLAIPVLLLATTKMLPFLHIDIWALIGPKPRFIFALVNAVAVLIIACP